MTNLYQKWVSHQTVRAGCAMCTNFYYICTCLIAHPWQCSCLTDKFFPRDRWGSVSQILSLHQEFNVSYKKSVRKKYSYLVHTNLIPTSIWNLHKAHGLPLYAPSGGETFLLKDHKNLGGNQVRAHHDWTPWKCSGQFLRSKVTIRVFFLSGT